MGPRSELQSDCPGGSGLVESSCGKQILSNSQGENPTLAGSSAGLGTKKRRPEGRLGSTLA